jgi:predicted ATPase
VRRVTLKSDDDLNRMLSELQLAEFIYEQPATGDVEYIFKHALTLEVAYNALLIERRKLLHERAGAALESLFAEQSDDRVDDLAHHYSRSDNIGKAVEYLGRAGRQALQRSAYADAIGSLSTGLDLLQRLPNTPERVQRELVLQLALGSALVPLKGYSAPEAERAYARARELCQQLGDPPELFSALYGLWGMHLVRGELRRSFELAEQHLRRAQSVHDPALLIYAEMVWGVSAYWMGEFIPVKQHLENAISIYDPDRHRLVAYRYGGIDAGIVCLTHDAWTLWQFGYPDQALKLGNEALALTRRLSNPFSQALCGVFLGVLRQYRRDAHAVQEIAEGVIAQSAEQGFIEWLADATALRGWAMAQGGHHEEGITQIREGLAASHAIGLELWRPYFLCLLAEAYMQMDRIDDGMAALTEALATADEHENWHNRAEIHRLKGELLLKQNASSTAEARSCFQRAIEIARKQSAKSWDLRATISLARLLRDTGRRGEARTMLAGIYNWFTEGFDTPDLKDAKALLDELGV